MAKNCHTTARHICIRYIENYNATHKLPTTHATDPVSWVRWRSGSKTNKSVSPCSSLPSKLQNKLKRSIGKNLTWLSVMGASVRIATRLIVASTWRTVTILVRSSDLTPATAAVAPTVPVWQRVASGRRHGGGTDAIECTGGVVVCGEAVWMVRACPIVGVVLGLLAETTGAYKLVFRCVVTGPVLAVAGVVRHDR